jgi:uncharacterized protein (DUF305 family)
MSRSLAYALFILFFISGVMVGYFLTPEYAVENERMRANHDLGPADRYVDLRYLDGMIAHHLAAIYLLEQAQTHSQRPEIQDLASAVIAADLAEIEELYDYKKDWYDNTRPVTEFEKINLGTADELFDLRLLNALLAHHHQAIDAAMEISTKSVRNEVLNLANQTATALSANAAVLESYRKDWYEL